VSDARVTGTRVPGRRTVVCAGLLGASAVAMGAFGAHALQGRLDARALGWYDTAAAYHATHALALLGCGLLAGTGGGGSIAMRRRLRLAGALLGIGTLVFAGSLYLMAFTGWTRLGMITPLGGVALIAGWLAMAAAAWAGDKDNGIGRDERGHGDG